MVLKHSIKGRTWQKRILILVLARNDVPERLSLSCRQQHDWQCLAEPAD